MNSSKKYLVQEPTRMEIFKKYAKYWYFFLIAVVLFLAGAYLYIQSTVPLYKISSTLLIQDDIKGDGMLKGTAFSDLDMFKNSRTVDNEMEILRSRDLIFQVLKEISMETSLSYELPLRSKELYGKELPVKVIVEQLNNNAYLKRPILNIVNEHEFSLLDNGTKVNYSFDQLIQQPGYKIRVQKGPAFKVSDQPIHFRFINLKKLAQAYSTAKLIVTPTVKAANTISISLLDAIPQRGVDILNLLIKKYNSQNVENKNLMAMNTIKFIDGKLQYLSKDLSAVEQDVENYKRNNMVTELGADAQMSLQNSGSYNQQLATANVQLSLVQSIISYLNDGKDSFDMVPTTMGLRDPILIALTDKYNNLQIERQRLLRTNSASNPLVTNITEQLMGLKSNILENLRVIRKGLVLEKNSFDRQSGQFRARLKNVPGIERGLLEKSREQSVKSGLYQYLLQKREETELSLSATIPTSQVIDKPSNAPVPVTPKVQLIYLVGLVLGFIFPAAIIYAKDQFNSKVQDLGDIEFLGDHARILGELSNKGKEDSIVVHKDQSTTISELFKYIRSNLHFLEVRNGSKVFLITSSIQGEGKTFFSINLGITLSLTSKKVVMLEFDLRKPDLLNNMKISAKIGLSEYLNDETIKVEDLLCVSPSSENLFVIGCGKIPRNPSEILMNEKIFVLFQELRKRFDYVIIDTPPVGQVSDAFSLAPFADASIYIVRYNYTNKDELSIYEEICRNQRLKNPMLVFNDARKENRNVYRYGRYSYSS